MNQKIGKIDLESDEPSKFSSLKSIMKNPTNKHDIVVALKVVVITFMPIYCNTAL
jgi:hypothetical protein